MQKTLLTLNLLFLVIALQANPIASPSIAISELYFDDNGKWIIELQYFDVRNDMAFDTIWIKSSSGISQVRRIEILGTTGVCLINVSST